MKIKKKNLTIAIDGPIGVGKSSLAFLLAQKLNLTYIYTGAMYRIVAYLALKNNLALNDQEKITFLLKKSEIKLDQPSKKDRYTDAILNGRNITHQLFTKETSRAVAYTSKLKKVRQYLVKLQQKLAKNKAVIMEGRDIGTKVLPQADLKIFLTADTKVRAERRWNQLKKINKPRSFAQVLKELNQRDKIDCQRQESPLEKAADAWILDTTKLTIPATVDAVINKLREKKLID